LKAKAFYHFLRCHKWSLSPIEHNSTFSLAEASSQNWCDPLEFLTDHQKLRLHRGFIGLSALRGRLRSMPMVNTKCRCLFSLRKKWTEAADCGRDIKDPKEFVEGVRGHIVFDYEHAGACGWLELQDQIDNFLNTFDDNLVKFFPKHL
jgi:hypothetical protein